MTLRSVAGPFLFVLCVLCVDLLFLIGILHTEIAKVAKTDLELDDPSIRGRSVPLCSL
jgi:hypothetical protein